LAEKLPLQVLDGDGFELVVGAPANRRRFLDWGVFHVEHGFLAAWRRFQRGLSHRNAMLRAARHNEAEWQVWTRELVMAGEALTQHRAAYFEQLTPVLRESVDTFLPEFGGSVECTFRQGWSREQSLEEALEQCRVSDELRGFTQVGPQRAELRLRVGNHLAADVLSRGQQKLLACALRLAQGQLFSDLLEGSGGSVVYLIDDLPAELDAAHLAAVCARLAAIRAQVFITAIDPEPVLCAWPAEQSKIIKMFHVERGMIRPD
jgi:DNA replication and repair protein RecF